MPLLDIANAITWDAALRHPNHFAITGDSHNSTMFNDTLQLQFTATHYFNQANARLGQRMKVVVNNAFAGQRSDQYLSQANINQIIASDAKWVIIYGIVNDVGQGFYDPFTTVIKAACEQFIAAGINVILVTDPGQTGVAGSTNARTAFQRYNSLIKSYAAQARVNGQVYVFDLASIVLDLTTTTIAFKSGYSADGTHWLVNAGLVQGRAFAAFILSLGVPPLPTRKVFGGETAVLGLQIFSNPGFLVTTGGTKGAFTGTAPAGVTNGALDTGISGVMGTTANADGTNDLTLQLTASQAGRARVFLDISAGHDSPGNIFDYFAECSVQSGATNLVAAEFFCEYNQSTNVPNSVDFVDLVGATSGIGTAGLGDIAETLNYWMQGTIPAGTRGYHSIHLDAHFSGAGVANINWRNLAVDLRQS